MNHTLQIIWVLGILPPGTFHPGIFPQGMFPPTLFRLVARFAHVRSKGTGLRQRHISRKARHRCFHAYFSWGEYSGGKKPGWNLQGEIFRGGIFRSPLFDAFDHSPVKRLLNNYKAE